LRAVRPDEVLNADEIKKLLNHVTPGLYLTLLATVAATGMRPEEIYALKWSDVSLDAARLYVRRSPSRIMRWCKRSQPCPTRTPKRITVSRCVPVKRSVARIELPSVSAEGFL
jgi:integrase